MHRKSLIAGAVVVILGVAAAGVAYAAIPGGDGTIQGCYTKVGGILRVVDSTNQCKNFENQISWSQKGPKGDPGTPGTNGTNGAPGMSPTVKQLTPGDLNCAAGGAAITDAAGSTAYVCSGQDGKAGADGQTFSGVFTSPNGQYSISVTDAGITIKHEGDALLTLLGNAVTVHSGTVAVDAVTTIDLTGANVAIHAGSNATVKSSGTANFEASGTTTIKGSTVSIN